MTKKSSNFRDAAFKATRKSRRVTIQTEDGPFDVEVRELSAKGRSDVLSASARLDDDGLPVGIDLIKLVPSLLIACVYDPETGEPLFTAADRDLIGNMPATLVDQVFLPAKEISALTADDADRLKGNSVATTADASSSPSPAN